MTSVSQAAQLAWETEAVDRGVDRYHKTCEQTDGADTRVGRAVGREVMGPLVKAVEAYQAMLLENPHGRGADRIMAMTCLPAVELAVLTTRLAVTASPRATTSLALELGGQCRLQRELALWKDAEARKVKHETAAGRHAVDLAKLMQAKSKKVDARVFRRWRRKADDFDRLEWHKSTQAWLGMTLLALVVEHGGGWFEFTTNGRMKGNRWVTERVLDLTPLARDWIQTKHQELEVTQPWFAPMLCKPRDWVRTPKPEVI